MRLPDSLFTQIVAALNPQPNGPDPETPAAGGAAPPWKRRAVRRRVNRQVWYVRDGAPDGQPQVGAVVDISKVGLGILLDGVAAPGERLIVHLPCIPRRQPGGADVAEGAQPYTVLCTVRSCRVRTDGLFRVGAEFTDAGEVEGPPLVCTVDGLAALSGEDPEALGRRAERHEADGRATMYLYRRGKSAPLERVAVADYSDTGVAIFRGEPLEVGAEFVIRVPRADETPITRLCRVANVACTDGRYRIGAEFIPFRRRGLLDRLRDWAA
ncbi:MAG TPA: PilZ domain-containing protein [Tepidisphaeraceae bacterium]|nr:PilZ domain-containing protein [Tepidisphaeraceae bacterium]